MNARPHQICDADVYASSPQGKFCHVPSHHIQAYRTEKSANQNYRAYKYHLDKRRTKWSEILVDLECSTVLKLLCSYFHHLTLYPISWLVENWIHIVLGCWLVLEQIWISDLYMGLNFKICSSWEIFGQFLQDAIIVFPAPALDDNRYHYCVLDT